MRAGLGVLAARWHGDELARCHQFNLYAIGVLEKRRVMLGATRKRMFVFVKNPNPPLPQGRRDFVDTLLRFDMEGEVVQSGCASMVRGLLESVLGLHEDDVGLSEFETAPRIPLLVGLVIQLA